MFLSAYHFDGDPAELAKAHDRLAERFPPGALALHLCVLGEHGIVVYDACPSRADFVAFSQSAEFLGAVDAAGLPRPRVEPLGDLHDVRVAS